MSLERMDASELAAFVRDTGTHVVNRRGVWWMESHPFFFRPLVPLREISAESRDYPVRSWLGGVQHPVPDSGPANSQKRYFIFENPQRYSLSTLPHHRVTSIRIGLKRLQWRRCTAEARFVTEAYPVYADFAARTGYGFKRERINPSAFARWAQALFVHPKIQVFGAYSEDRLRAVSIFYFVERLIVNSMYFSDTESQKYQVHDFVLHQLREDAARTDADAILMGPHTGIEGIDRAKVIRGCTLITKRTYLRLNPAAAFALKRLRPELYARLLDAGKSVAAPSAPPTQPGGAKADPASPSPLRSIPTSAELHPLAPKTPRSTNP